MSYQDKPDAFPDFLQQFVLYLGGLSAGARWTVKELNGWSLASHETLRVVDVETSDGTHVGWLLGNAINREGIVARKLRLPVSSPDQLEESVIEETLYQFGGRYALAIIADGCARFYVDPLASLGAVFSRSAPLMASTTTLIGGRELAMGAFPSNRSGQFYPAGLTHDESIRRILPNHYLDLNSWEGHRHWPKQATGFAEERDVDPLIDVIIARIEENIAGIAGAYPLFMGLTSGRDSRMILACSRKWIDHITCVTFDYQNNARLTAVDLYMARRLSRRFRVRHQILPVAAASEDEKRAYWRRIGYAGGSGKVRDFDKACRHLERDAGWINGFPGGVGKDAYWRKKDPAGDTLTGADLLARMNLDSEPGFVEGLDEWLAGVPANNAYEVLNLAYLEQRVGCWASPHMYGGAQAHAISPFCHRDIVEAMLRLPVKHRRNDQMAVDVVRRAWPEMADLPYHSFQGWRRGLERIRNAPAAVRRRL